MSFGNNNCSLALNLKSDVIKNEDKSYNIEKNNNDNSFGIMTKISMNLANMLGPAVICLPFVLQKSGFIFTLISILFLNLFSTFSSLCLIEAAKFLKNSKLNNTNRIEYNELIQSLIKDKIFTHSCKLSVILSHLIYSILCSITLCKVVGTIIIKNYPIQINHWINPINSKIKQKDFLTELNYVLLKDGQISILLICFLTFLIYFVINQRKTAKIIFNILILISAIMMSFCLLYYLIQIIFLTLSGVRGDSNLQINQLDLIGSDFTYLYGTLLFSFNYVTAIPIWFEDNKKSITDGIEDSHMNSSKFILSSSSFIGIIFKIFFALLFALIIKFDSEFSIAKYLTKPLIIGSDIFGYLMIFITFLVAFLILTLLNSIATHTILLYKSVYMHNNLLNKFVMTMSFITPWVMSLLLIARGGVFLNILNWSSIFLFGFVNFILPLILYLQAVNQNSNYEKNYRQSAILDFDNFVRLKREEIGLIEVFNGREKNKQMENHYILSSLSYDFNDVAVILNILSEIQKKTSNENCEVNLEIKEKIVSLVYRMEGHYSLQLSFNNLLSGLITSKNKAKFFFFTINLCLLFFIFFSIYVALYYFVINKTMVVNIFLQNNK